MVYGSSVELHIRAIHSRRNGIRGCTLVYIEKSIVQHICMSHSLLFVVCNFCVSLYAGPTAASSEEPVSSILERQAPMRLPKSSCLRVLCGADADHGEAVEWVVIPNS